MYYSHSSLQSQIIQRLVQQYQNLTTLVEGDIESYFDLYESKIHHFPLLPITWEDGLQGDNYFKTLWNYENKFEQVCLFVGFFFSTYLLPGGDYKLQSWAVTEEKSHLCISLDKNSRFFHDYMEKLESIEKELKEGCDDLVALD